MMKITTMTMMMTGRLCRKHHVAGNADDVDDTDNDYCDEDDDGDDDDRQVYIGSSRL